MARLLRNAWLTAALAFALRAQAPPLIDREIFFAEPEITGAQISPDGKYIAFLKPWKDTRNLWVTPATEPNSAARLLTAEAKRPLAQFLWTADSKYLCYVTDTNGDGNFNLFAVDPAKPPGRNLTGLKGAHVELVNAQGSDPDIVFATINDRDRNWPDLYRVKISSGEKTLLHRNTESISGWVFDLSGRLRLATRAAANGDREILRVDAAGLTKIYSCSVFEICNPVRFRANGKQVFLETNAGDNADLMGLAIFDPETGKAEPATIDPLKRGDLLGAVVSNDTGEILETSYFDDKPRHYFSDPISEADFHWLEDKLPGKEINIVSETASEQVWLITAEADTEPGETFLFDRKLHTLTFRFRVYESLPRLGLAPTRAIHYQSADGLEIEAYLTLPVGVAGKRLPTVVVAHPGPWSREVWGFNAQAQFWANRGYAVLMPNYRGSIGFGRKFVAAGNGEWGRKMQEDLTSGVRYLVSEGIADADRVGIMGEEYGGYAALAGAAFTPDLYRAAIDVAGPSNLTTMLGVIPAYWEGGRREMYTRLANPASPEGTAWLKDRSPLFSADKIKAAMLIAQGGNDPQTVRGETERIVAGLHERGVPVSYLFAPDEGHGFHRSLNRMALMMAAESFLGKYLGGRYQENGIPAVTKRLAEISVEAKRVRLETKVDGRTVGLPQTAADLKPETILYRSKLSGSAEEATWDGSTAIREENGLWDVTESASGQVIDGSLIEKGTLAVRKRVFKEGAVTVNTEFQGGKASGTRTAGAQSRPVAADIGGEIFADGAGAAQSIGSLPLAEGYTARFLNFDHAKLKSFVVLLKVAGSETVTVPAGEFDAWRVEMTAAGGGTDVWTVWVAKGSHRPVKEVRIAASLNGATLTREMLP